MKALANSNSIRALESLRDCAPIAVDRDDAEYLLQEREQFARAYAQFIAVGAADGMIEGELQRISTSANAVEREMQWAAADFVPIQEALGALLAKMGWAV